MRFDVFRQSDGRILVVPVVLLRSMSIAGSERSELVGRVVVDPHLLSDELLKALGRDGCATPEGADAVLFESGVTLDERLSMGMIKRR